MSKSSSPCTPQRTTRHGRSRDAASYADMLIEQLLAQASSVTDSSPETSPPSNEDADSSCLPGSPYNNLNNNNNNKPLPGKLEFPSPHTGSQMVQSPQCVTLTPAPIIHYQIPTNSQTEEVQGSNRNSACYATTDSGVTSSDAGQPVTTMASTASVTSLSTSNKQNLTSGSTPELPTSGSSDSLDIPFASMFDINCSQLFPEEEGSTPRSGPISPAASVDIGASPMLSQSTFGSFPTRYSHSYARELKQLETDVSPQFSTHSPQLPSRPASAPIDNSLLSNDFSYQEELVVRLPPTSRPSTLRDFNINHNYKPHLSDKLATEFSESEEERPPLPPRRPLTDSKLVQYAARPALPARRQPATPSSLRHSPLNSSWSFYELSGSRPDACGSQTPSAPAYVTVRDRRVLSPLDPMSVVTSASKRRRANDKTALPVEDVPARSARQRLHFTPCSPLSRFSSRSRSSPVASSSPSSTPGTKSLMRPRKKTKRQSPAMRRLAQQKENLSPSPLTCRPLNDLNNFNRNDSYLLTTSSNSLTQSSDTYARSTDTSPDIIPFLSREEELLERDAYYCDFTVDRQRKIDNCRKLNVLKPSTNMNVPQSSELLVRTVEGAESSPVFQIPAASLRAPKPVRRQRPMSAALVKPLSSDLRSSSSSSGHHPSKPCSRSSSTSSRSSRRKVVTHPLASSTMMDDPSPEPDYGSVYTWSIDDESSQCDLEKSYLRSTKKPKRNLKTKNTTPRPATTCGHDTTDSDTSNFRNSAFEISAMVTAIDETMKTTCPVTPVSKSKSKQIMTAAPSFMKRLSGSCTSDSSGSQFSDPSSNQATTSSAAFNLAKGSMVISSSEPSQLSTQAASRRLSTSEPVLPGHYYDDTDPETGSIMSSSLDNQRPEIPGKSSSSSSSPVTAARCRPYRRKLEVSSPDLVCTVTGCSTEVKSTSQDLLDSILTDSPRSVDSSGILPPYNSYTSPVESVGSHNGYSSTVSSSVASSDYPCTGRQAPPATPPFSQSQLVLNTPAASATHGDDFDFKRPFNPIPFNQQNCSTKNQGVSASALTLSASAVALSPSLHTADSANSEPCVFAVPPGLRTGPPKIKDKKSLVRKLKKFSSNFYKKTEKITTLANL